MITELTRELIRIASVTPDDGGCMPLIREYMEPCGFTATPLRYADVDNIWLQHGNSGPVLCFLGHTDVVPAGHPDDWDSKPFLPEIRDGYLYGRGAADMKGSIAAMVSAFQHFILDNPDHKGTLAMLLTSDEEGEAVNGTRKVIEYLSEQGISINWCVVGEPTSQEQVGDMVKIGRRGSLTGHLTVAGVQGHVAYPHKASNPVHLIAPALHELCDISWDAGNEHYDPTSFQISNINAGTGADNVVPGKLKLQFNIRYSTETTEDAIKKLIVSVLERHGLKFELNWLPSSKPFLTPTGRLVEITARAVEKITGIRPVLSTTGGTSDGRFVAPTGAEVIELGPVNSTIHKVNECVRVSDLETLASIYHGIIDGLLGKNADQS